MLEKVGEQAAQLLQLETVIVGLFHEIGEDISLHVWSKQNKAQTIFRDTLAAVLRPAEAISLIRERGELVTIEDTSKTRLLPATLGKQCGIRSIAMFPLTTARGIIGFLLAPKFTRYFWNVDDTRLGLAFSAQSATAIENARLFATLQQHNRRIEIFNAMAQLLGTLPDPNQHLNLILQRIAEVMDLDVGMLLLREQGTDGLTMIACCGMPEEIFCSLHNPLLKPLHALAYQVEATGEGLLFYEEKHHGGKLQESLCAIGFCGLLAVPLMASNTVLGVLMVGSYHMQELTEEDLTLFTTIGQQLGMALKNAELLRAASGMEALREADRLKSWFIAAISHDLRSPLTAIRASVESLLDQGGIQSVTTQEHLLQNIAGQAGRLGRLVDQLLDLSHIEAGALSLDRDWTELPVLIADTLAKFEELNSGCRVVCDLAEDLPLAYVDPDSLVQVLWNLLENASKYAPPCSPILIEARWNGTEMLIGVADRGPGIPAKEHEMIFQHFYRLNRDQRTHTRGSGLGLAICRGIVQAHGGRIWVEDRPGGGSIFRIALPLTMIAEIGLETPDEHELYAVSLKEM